MTINHLCTVLDYWTRIHYNQPAAGVAGGPPGTLFLTLLAAGVAAGVAAGFVAGLAPSVAVGHGGGACRGYCRDVPWLLRA